MTLAEFWGQKFATQGQYFFTRVISQRLGALLAYAAGRMGLSPNAVTLLGLLVSLAACLSLALSAESEGLLVTALVLFQVGFALDCADGSPMRQISLQVHSSLDGVGLTAAVSGLLAEHGIACNMVAAFHHDHLFVPADRAEEALALLQRLQRAPR